MATLLSPMHSYPVAAQPPLLDQANWSAAKKMHRLSNGITLACIEAGDPAGEPLVLLHGWTDTSRSWSLLLLQLSSYRLIIPDLRGHGASDKPDCSYAIGEFAHDIRLLLDAKGIARASFAGHSLGSFITQRLAFDHPERVDRIVLIGSTVSPAFEPGGWLWDEVMKLGETIDPDDPFIVEWANGPTPIDPVFLAAVRPETAATPQRVLARGRPRGRHDRAGPGRRRHCGPRAHHLGRSGPAVRRLYAGASARRAAARGIPCVPRPRPQHALGGAGGDRRADRRLPRLARRPAACYASGMSKKQKSGKGGDAKRVKVSIPAELADAFEAAGDSVEEVVERLLRGALGQVPADRTKGKLAGLIQDIAGPHLPQLEAIAKDVASKVAKDVATAAAAAALSTFAAKSATAGKPTKAKATPAKSTPRKAAAKPPSSRG